MTDERKKLSADAVIREHYMLIRRIVAGKLARGSGRDVHADINDLCQEICMAVCTSLHTLRDPEKLGAWLVNLVNNHVNMFFRKKYSDRRKMEGYREVSGPPVLSAGQVRNIWHREIHGMVRVLLDDLPPRHRQIMRLRFYDGYTVAEIAGKLAITPQRVSDCISYAKRALRKELGKRKEMSPDFDPLQQQIYREE